MTKPRILIMAGGTGGHIFPAQAVAIALQAQGWEIHWLGSATRMEATLVPKFGWPFHSIDVAGIRGKGISSVLSAPWMLLKSFLQARAVVRKVKPSLVLGFGGFASGPGGVAAWKAGIPLLIHEQNAVAGSTNRILAKLAKQVLVAFPAAFAGHPKQVVVGNPVRAAVLDAASQHSFAGQLKILVLGGSLGAKALNETLPGIFAKAAEHGQIDVKHQAGNVLFAATQQQYSTISSENLSVEVCAFIDDMSTAYSWADIVICRAGASTVSELSCAGVAALFVPLPNAIDDHQTANANWLVQQNAAFIMSQTGLTEQALLPMLLDWMKDKTILQQMAQRARKCALDNAAAQVVAQCQQVASQQLTGRAV